MAEWMKEKKCCYSQENSLIKSKREVEQPEIKWEMEMGDMFLQPQSFAGIPLLTGILV